MAAVGTGVRVRRARPGDASPVDAAGILIAAVGPAGLVAIAAGVASGGYVSVASFRASEAEIGCARPLACNAMLSEAAGRVWRRRRSIRRAPDDVVGIRTRVSRGRTDDGSTLAIQADRAFVRAIRRARFVHAAVVRADRRVTSVADGLAGSAHVRAA